MKSTPIQCALRNVSFAYPPSTLILRDLSFEAFAGETTALFGPSGAGKTTCLRLIAGLERPSRGVIEIGGVAVASPVTWTPPHERGVGYCFQEAALWPNVRVFQHIEIPMRPRIADRNRRHTEAHTLLERFGLLEFARRFPTQLSGGQQRRLAFARAVAAEPRLLLLDEPLSSVEGQLREEMAKGIRAARRSDRAIVLVTHHLEEALSLADRMVILSAGEVIQQGVTQEVYRDPGNVETARLLGYASFIPARLESGMIQTELGQWPSGMDGDSTNGIAAWTMESLKVQPSEDGPYLVRECVYLGHSWRVSLTKENQQLIAHSREPLALETPAQARATQPPAWIPQP